MSLQRAEAIPADAQKIAEIHMAAFGANAMLRAQFPTPSVRAALKEAIRTKTIADIQDPRITVLVVRDPGIRRPHTVAEVIAFAKWSHPVLPGEGYTEAPWIWPEGTDHAILAIWTKKMEDAQERATGGRPCYRTSCARRATGHRSRTRLTQTLLNLGLTFIGTDPAHEKRGAGSLLVDWGKDRSREENVPLYLESTLEAASFYQNHGFVSREKVSLSIGGTGNEPNVYEEVIFTFEPESDGKRMEGCNELVAL